MSVYSPPVQPWFRCDGCDVVWSADAAVDACWCCGEPGGRTSARPWLTSQGGSERNTWQPYTAVDPKAEKVYGQGDEVTL